MRVRIACWYVGIGTIITLFQLHRYPFILQYQCRDMQGSEHSLVDILHTTWHYDPHKGSEKNTAFVQCCEGSGLSNLPRISHDRALMLTGHRDVTPRCKALTECRLANEFGSCVSATSSGNAPFDRDDTIDSVRRNADVP